MHFAGGDLFFCRADEAEFADTNSLLRAHGRAEDAARHGAVRVEVAGAGVWVQRGARLVVAVIFEGHERRVVVAENAGNRVPRKIGSEARECFGDTLVDTGGAPRIGAFEFGESGAEAGGVKLGDLEDADATLRAADTAGEMGAALLDRTSQFGVDDLDKTLVAGR